MTCPVHLKNQVLEEQEQGRELTEAERQLVEADDDEIQAVVPNNYGPLSNWDGTYCKFCHSVGQAGAIVVGLLTGLFFLYLIDVGQPAALGLGAGIWVLLAYTVGKKGYFPILGPKLGPIVERLFAAFGVYLTATARREHQETATAGGTTLSHSSDDLSIEDIEIDDTTPLPEDYLQSKNHETEELKRQLQEKQERVEKWKKLAEKRREKKQEKDSEIIALRDEKETLHEQKQQIEKAKKESIEERKELENAISLGSSSGMTRGPGDPDPGDALPVMVPHGSGDSHVGPFWMLKTIDYKHPKFGVSVPIPFGVWDLSDLGDIPKNVSDVLDQDELHQLEEFLILDPDDLDQPIEVRSTSHPKYEEGDVALFHGDIGGAKDIQEDGHSPDTDWSWSILTLGLDTNGNPIPTKADTRGFEDRNEMRNTVQKVRQQFRQMKHVAERREERIEDLQHELQLAEEERKEAKVQLEHLREQHQDAIEGRRTQAYNQGVLEDSNRYLHDELQRKEEETELAHERARRERREKLDESDSMAAERKQIESQSERKQREIEIVNEIHDVWEHEELDPSSFENGDRSKFIRDFLNADKDDLNKAAEKKQKEVTGMLVGEGEPA